MTMKAASSPPPPPPLSAFRGSESTSPRQWLYGGSASRSAVVAGVAGLAVFGAGLLLGGRLLGRERPRAAMALTDVLSGVLAAMLVFDALRHARQQRSALLGRDEII